MIRPYGQPLKQQAGFKVLNGNLFNSAVMKVSVISQDFRDRFLSNPKDPNAFEGRAVVFDGPEDYHRRIDDPALAIDERTLLFIRGAGPIGYPGSAEVVNMQPPRGADQTGHHLPALHRRRPAIGHVGLTLDSQCHAGGGGRRRPRPAADRRPRAHRPQRRHRRRSPRRGGTRGAARRLQQNGGYRYPPSQTPWQEIQRGMVEQLADGMVLTPAVKFRRVAQTSTPRDNH